jgi:hypothetical protein
MSPFDVVVGGLAFVGALTIVATLVDIWQELQSDRRQREMVQRWVAEIEREAEREAERPRHPFDTARWN